MDETTKKWTRRGVVAGLFAASMFTSIKRTENNPDRFEEVYNLIFENPEKTSYSKFLENLEGNKIKRILVCGNNVFADHKDGTSSLTKLQNDLHIRDLISDNTINADSIEIFFDTKTPLLNRDNNWSDKAVFTA